MVVSCQRGVTGLGPWLARPNSNPCQEIILKHLKETIKKYDSTQRVDDTYDEMPHPMGFRNDLPWRMIEFPTDEVKTLE